MYLRQRVQQSSDEFESLKLVVVVVQQSQQMPNFVCFWQ